jgi:hypothetical protein
VSRFMQRATNRQAIGPNYKQVLVQPGIGSLTREVMAQYTAEQVYSTARLVALPRRSANIKSERMGRHRASEISVGCCFTQAGERQYRLGYLW